MSSIIKKGLTTIVWSPEGMLPNIATIIESGRITPKNGAPFEIEGMNGATKTNVYLDDGFDGEFTCVYDSNIAYPAMSNSVNVVLPNFAAAAGNTLTYNCECSSRPQYDPARKKESMIIFKVTYRPDVNGAPA